MVNLAFNEAMFFETQRMSSERPLSGRVVRSFEIQVAKATEWTKERPCGGEYKKVVFYMRDPTVIILL